MYIKEMQQPITFPHTLRGFYCILPNHFNTVLNKNVQHFAVQLIKAINMPCVLRKCTLILNKVFLCILLDKGCVFVHLELFFDAEKFTKGHFYFFKNFIMKVMLQKGNYHYTADFFKQPVITVKLKKKQLLMFNFPFIFCSFSQLLKVNINIVSVGNRHYIAEKGKQLTFKQ